jgi:pilus assembly protein CpaB
VRKGGSIVLLLVAVLMGSVAAVLARAWLQGQAQAGRQPVGTIVVAAAPMQFGTVITEDKVSEIEILSAADNRPPGAFATKQEFFKDGRRMALSSMERNEAVLRNKITAPGQRGSFSTLIDGGKRAVSVAVDGVAGFIQPNDRVDVVLICTKGAANGRGGYSDLILKDMKVFASDQITGQQVEQPSAVVKAVTLEATPEDAQKLVLATDIGRLSLILRQPIEEAGDGPVRRITAKDLCDVPPEIAKVAPPPAAPKTVVVTRGGKQEKYSVPPYTPTP